MKEIKDLTTKILNPKAKQVYQLIRTYKIITKFDLIELTNMKAGTVTNILEELLSGGFIIEAGYGESTGGRKPILYSIHSTYAYIIGLDLSRTNSILVLTDMNMNIIDVYSWKMTKQLKPITLLQQVVETIHVFLKKHNISKDKILGMGVGTIGPLDGANRIMLEPFGFPSTGWKNLAVCDFFENELHLPVFLDNGACNALRGEFWKYSSQNNQNLVYFHVGIGLRSALMSNGKVMSGAIGQMIIQTDGLLPYNPYGNYGSLHSYATIQFIIDMAMSRLKQGRKSILWDFIDNVEQVNYNHLLNALNNEDPMVVELFTQSATYFGIGLANLINILHPEKIILGGPLIFENEMFYNLAVEVASKKTYYFPFYKVNFTKSKLEEDGLAVGATAMVIDQLII